MASNTVIPFIKTKQKNTNFLSFNFLKGKPRPKTETPQVNFCTKINRLQMGLSKSMQITVSDKIEKKKKPWWRIDKERISTGGEVDLQVKKK